MNGINIVIKGKAAEELTEAICSEWNYRPILTDNHVNPENKEQFTERKIKSLLTKIIENYVNKKKFMEVS